MTKHEKTPMNAETQGAMPVHKNVYVALAAAQSEMGPLVKGSTNPHFRSKYADLADLVIAVREPFNRNGLTYFHQIVRGEGFQDMRTVLVHGETESKIECDVPLIVQKQDMQGMKSATTYAKRIGLESVSGVAPEDDDGQAAVTAAPQQQASRFDASAATKRIKGKLAQATTLDDLKDRWTQESDTIGEVKAASANLFFEIERVKNERREAIQQSELPASQPRASDDLGSDEIPY